MGEVRQPDVRGIRVRKGAGKSLGRDGSLKGAAPHFLSHLLGQEWSGGVESWAHRLLSALWTEPRALRLGLTSAIVAGTQCSPGTRAHLGACCYDSQDPKCGEDRVSCEAV